MSGHKIDAEFIGKLTEARIAAHKEVETNTYYGHTPEARMVNFSAGIENGLGGDVGKFLGMLDPETVFLIVDELVVRRRRMRNIRTMADYDLGAKDLAPVVLPTEYVESFADPESALAKFLKCDSAVVIPMPDANLHARVDELERENADLKEQRDDYQSAYRTSADAVRQWEKTCEVFAKERDSEKERADALQAEVQHQKGLVESYKESFETSNETVKTSAKTEQRLLAERTTILGRIIDWENAYRDGRTGQNGDLASRVSELINAYGSLYQSVTNANNVLKAQNDELDAFRDSDASPEVEELLREVDVLGAYLKYPVRETETETRLEIVKAALTKIEEQDELIGTLQRALVAAQSGQPRRPTGIREESEKVAGSESQPVANWFEKVFKDLYADVDIDRLPKLGGPLDEMLRHLFDK